MGLTHQGTIVFPCDTVMHPGPVVPPMGAANLVLDPKSLLGRSPIEDIFKAFVGVSARLAVTYALMGLACSLIVEFWSGLIHQRFRTLRRTMQDALGESLAREFFKHHLIESLGRFPSYIPIWLFPLVVSDTIEKRESKYKEAPEGISRDGFLDALTVLKKAGVDERGRTEAIERWFGSVLDGASARYASWVRLWILILASLLTLGLGFNTVYVLQRELPGYFAGRPPDNPRPFSEIGDLYDLILACIGYTLSALLVSTAGMAAFDALNRLTSHRSEERPAGKSK